MAQITCPKCDGGFVRDAEGGVRCAFCNGTDSHEVYLLRRACFAALYSFDDIRERDGYQAALGRHVEAKRAARTALGITRAPEGAQCGCGVVATNVMQPQGVFYCLSCLYQAARAMQEAA